MNFEQTEDRKNIIRLLENDDILRNKYLLSFLKIMNNNGKNRIFSLDGNWGSGKTIFVRKLELCHHRSLVHPILQWITTI